MKVTKLFPSHCISHKLIILYLCLSDVTGCSWRGIEDGKPRTRGEYEEF